MRRFLYWALRLANDVRAVRRGRIGRRLLRRALGRSSGKGIGYVSKFAPGSGEPQFTVEGGQR